MRNPISFKPAQSFAFRPGSATFGLVVIEGFRTVDGKNFYNDDARPRISGAGLGGFASYRITDEGIA
jgi:hypothetical protein